MPGPMLASKLARYDSFIVTRVVSSTILFCREPKMIRAVVEDYRMRLLALYMSVHLIAILELYNDFRLFRPMI